MRAQNVPKPRWHAHRLARGVVHVAAVLREGAADSFRYVGRWHPRRVRRLLVLPERADYLVYLLQVILAATLPLAELGIVDTAVDEDHKAQPMRLEGINEGLHVQPKFLALTAAHPLKIRSVQLPDQRHPVHNDRAGQPTAVRGVCELWERRRVLSSGQLAFHVRVQPLDSHAVALYR